MAQYQSYNVNFIFYLYRDNRPVEVREIHRETIREVYDQKEFQKVIFAMLQ